MSGISLPINLSKIRSTDGKIIFTYEDISSLPEWPEGPLLEIYKGDIFNLLSPTIQHQRISKLIEKRIDGYLDQHNIGELFQAPIDVKFSDENVAIPDLFLVLHENKEIIGEKFVNGAPDLVIEIISTNKKHDYVDKKELYEQFGVKEYWIVDPNEKIIIVNVLKDGKYANISEYKYNEKIRSSILKTMDFSINFLDK